MRLRFTLEGAAELDAVLAYLDERSPQGSRSVKLRIQAITQLIVQHPFIGKLTRSRRLRYVSAWPYLYLIFYQTTEDEIIIHGVRHSARKPSAMPGN